MCGLARAAHMADYNMAPHPTLFASYWSYTLTLSLPTDLPFFFITELELSIILGDVHRVLIGAHVLLQIGECPLHGRGNQVAASQ